MGKILTFPDRHDQASSQDFLQFDDDTLNFGSAGGQKADQEYTFPLPKSATSSSHQTKQAKDWDNQELAHLFRVKRLLDLAGVPNSIDRGLTDEGDPWFLFCDARDEVFIHLCRIDGLYLLDNPSIETPLSGRNFSDLIDAFIQRKVRGQSNETLEGNHKIVHLQRNGNVFLHPATMLAALIWTLFLEAEDLVMVLPKDGEDLGEPGDPLETVSSETLDQISTAIEGQLKALPDLTPELESANAQDGHTKSLARSNLTESESKINQNTYAMGLSVIAISFGLIADHHTSEFERTKLGDLLSLLENEDGTGQENHDALSETLFDSAQQMDFLTALQQVFNHNVLATAQSEKTEDTPEVLNHVAAKLLEDIKTDLKEVKGEMVSFAQDLTQSVREFSETTVQAWFHIEPTTSGQDPKALLASSSDIDVTKTASVFTKFGLVDISEKLSSVSMQSYTIDTNTLYASFDINATELGKTKELITNESSASHEQDDNMINVTASAQPDQAYFQKNASDAAKFISYLLAKEGNLDIISIEKELIFIDPDVFDVSPSDAYVKSWEVENGETVSVIGLQSDYSDFSLTV